MLELFLIGNPFSSMEPWQSQASLGLTTNQQATVVAVSTRSGHMPRQHFPTQS